MSLSLSQPLAASSAFSQHVASRFSRAARNYDTYATVQQQVAKEAIDSYAWQADDTVLDIGAGTGGNTHVISTQVASAVGVDLSAGMVEQASAQHPQLTFVEGDAAALPFATASFSVVFSSMALQWCLSPAHVLTEIDRVLLPGGSAVLAVMIDGSFAELKAAQRAANVANTLMPLASGHCWQRHCQASALAVKECRHAQYMGEYDDVFSLLRSISRVGASATNSSGQLMTRRDIRGLSDAYTQHETQQRKLPLSYQLLHFTLEKV